MNGRNGVESGQNTNGPAPSRRPGPDIQEASPGCTTTLTPLAAAAQLLLDAMRDKTWKADTPLGAAVSDYLAWKQNEDGAKGVTIDTYERVLAQLVIFSGAGLDDLTIDHLRVVRDLRPPKSRYLVTAVYKDFCRWLYEEGLTETNVAGRLRYPKREKPPLTGLFADEEKAAIVAAAETIRTVFVSCCFSGPESAKANSDTCRCATSTSLNG